MPGSCLEPRLDDDVGLGEAVCLFSASGHFNSYFAPLDSTLVCRTSTAFASSIPHEMMELMDFTSKTK